MSRNDNRNGWNNRQGPYQHGGNYNDHRNSGSHYGPGGGRGGGDAANNPYHQAPGRNHYGHQSHTNSNGGSHYNDHDRGRQYERGYRGHGGADRSRSRDRQPMGYPQQHRGPFHRGGRGPYFQGRGGGRGFHGRGNGHGGGRRWNIPRPETQTVMVNYYKLELEKDSNPEWFQYEVEIKSAIRKKIFDEEKKFQDYEVVVNPNKTEPIDFRRGSELSRRIMKKIALDEKLPFVSDGKGIAYAPFKLFEGEIKDWKFFDTVLPRNCDVDEVDATLVQNSRFLVKFTLVAAILPSVAFLNSSQDVAEYQKTRQAIDVILKSTMNMIGMKAFGQNPRAFYFPDKMQPGVLIKQGDQSHGRNNQQTFRHMLQNGQNLDYMPMLGLFQAVRFCKDGNNFGCYINSDTVVDYANREFRDLLNQRVPIELLNERERKICGVSIDSLHNYIINEAKKREITEKLKNILINVKYEIPMDPNFYKRMKEKGLSDENIHKMNVKVRRNKKLHKDPKNNDVQIIWGADDESLYSFEEKKRVEDGIPPKVYTVYTYNKERYNIKLRYPKMPIVFLGNNEWFPIEFLYQSFGKMKNANSTDQVNAVLDYYDKNSGTKYIGNVTEMFNVACREMENIGMTYDQMLKQYNLTKSCDPVRLEARVLKEPTLMFGANRDADIKNGDWGIIKGNQELRFKKPAKMNSFAVINLAGSRDRCVYDFMRFFLKSAEKHGLEIPNVDRELLLRNIVSHVEDPSPENIEKGFHEGVTKAKNYFALDSYMNYRNKNVWFRSRVKRQGLYKTGVQKEEPFYDCLVFHAPANTNGQVVDAIGLILASDIGFATHRIEVNGVQVNARLMVKVRETPEPIDPFSFYYDYNAGCHKALNGTEWVPVRFEGRLFQVGNELYTEEQVSSTAFPIYMLSGGDIMKYIELPSIVFVVLPEQITELYGVTKLISHFQLGVQSQVIIASKYRKQKKIENYCSNIAIKVNAKLSSQTNKAHVWSTHHNGIEGIPWVSEPIPTFVLGLSISNTMGLDAVSIIGASACLDNSCMRFAQDVQIQSKTEIIDRYILINLTKGLLIQYYLENRKVPERILVYRDGVSDGSFGQVQAEEVQCIRQGFLEFKKEIFGESSCTCELCEKKVNKGCLFCTPPITFVVCMTKNNIKIVPANSNGHDKNVFSGTVLDQLIMDMPNLQINETENIEELSSKKHLIYTVPDGKGYDFVLVAHGGKKGTSKTVHYRIILNENGVWRPNNPNATPLTKEVLELLTFHMSFQYSTASKATRVIPIVHYSSRLANMMMHYLNYLRATKGPFEKQIIKEDESKESEGPRNRDGTLRDRFQYIRKDFKDMNMSSHLKTSLLPGFAAALDESHDDSQAERPKYQSPFFSHIAA